MDLRNLIVICHSPASEGVSVDTSSSSGEGRGDESRRDAAIGLLSRLLAAVHAPDHGFEGLDGIHRYRIDDELHVIDQW